ncbi:MAG: AraC family transcriptional regulator [Marinobacter sp.]|uniref:AraC family transcriptional regulator n=1 Tax=Marinobacter sp. TaxID=50741 RepID=UPI00299E6B3D|nr:AraC family transcriptional regulator [Marinobacter sp.]MDX1755151.1 AraC family transcriptional regulator [Marinobacter sp.]
MSTYPSELKADLPLIKAHYADILCQLVEEKGVSPLALLAEAEIRPSVLGHPDNMITVKQFVALNRAALKLSAEPALGLEYGRRLKFTTHGALSQAAISSDTIEEGLKVLIKYFRIRFGYMDLTFYTEGRDAVLELQVQHDLQDLHVFNVEVVMASIMDVNLLLFGTRLLDGGECRLSYPRPDHHEAYQALFGEAVRFSQGANQLRFRKEFLTLPLALSNPVARRVAEEQCEVERRHLESRFSAVGRVEQLLRSVQAGRLPGLEEVSERLGVSARTLRRQLSAEGMKFQALQDRVRHERARELLVASGLGIDDIAYRLGYSDPSNFGRAFRKWEGVSPSAYRAARR